MGLTMKQERQFKGIWIPANIWLNPELSAIDKILLADIDSFTGNQKKFYKSNETIATELFVSIKSISRSVKKLKDLGFIIIEGNKRQRLISSTGQYERVQSQSVYDMGQNVQPERSESLTTNTMISTTTNTTTNDVVLPFESQEFLDIWTEWNKSRKKKYKDGGKRALKRLCKLSDNNEQEAIDILEFSLAQNYQGIYPENKKNDKRNSKKFNTSVYTDYLDTL